MALPLRRLAEPPTPAGYYNNTDFSLTEVSLLIQDLSWRVADGSPAHQTHHRKLENEVMVDPWSSMESTNSPLTDSGPSASEDCSPSTSSEPPHLDVVSQARSNDKTDMKSLNNDLKDKTRAKDLKLDLDNLETTQRRKHFLDDDYNVPQKTNVDCRIPKPHFLDHSPSPDEFDERSDITNPNFLDDDVDANEEAQKRGALPKRPERQQKVQANYPNEDERPHTTHFRSHLHYGLERAAQSTERDKRASQLYRGTWPGEAWQHDTASVRSFSSNGSDAPRPSSKIDNKVECVYSLLSLLSLSPDNNADLSGPLLEMSKSVESCIAMRQSGCIPLLVQLIHSKLPRETRDRAAKALRNIIHTQTDDKAGRREARVWRLLEQVREYCYLLEDIIESRKEEDDTKEDDMTKHPSQSVAALMKLSFDEEHRHVVCQLGGLQALAALVSSDQAVHGSRTDDNTCLTMRKYAGMTLTNLTFGDGNNKSLLCSFKDFMMALVEQLESPNDDMRQVTAAVLRNLSWRADTHSKQVLREVGAVAGLTKAAMTCQKEATLKSVLSALWNLTAHCSMNKVALCSVEGALGFLVDMLSYNSPTKTLAIVENAGGIMRNVSSHIAVREDYRQILRERNCLSVLLQHLKSPSLTVVSNSCGTLWNLSARCPHDQQYLWDHGAVPMLRSLIHSKHKMIAMGSGAALKNLLNSKPGKNHIIALDSTARNMNLPALPTLGVRKQKALEQELDQNLAETCDNIEPATSPTTSNRDEKNLFSATERQIAMNLERHRMTASSPLMGTLTSQTSLSHSAHLAGYLSCSNTLLKGALVSRPITGGSAGNVNRSESKDSVTSTHSDSVFEKVMRTGKVPIPTPRTKDAVITNNGNDNLKPREFLRYQTQPPVPPPRSTCADIPRTNYTEAGFDVDQESCDQPIDYSRKYTEKSSDTGAEPEEKAPQTEVSKKKDQSYGDYQETDLDQPTDYSLRYAEHQSETGSDISEPTAPSVHEDTIKHFCTEGTPYETPIIFSTATSMSDLRVISKDQKKAIPTVKPNPEVMTQSDEKDTCSIEEPIRPDNDAANKKPQPKQGVFETKFSSGMISPEKPINYCDEGTPGCFSRVSSLSSIGDPTEEDNLAKKNAMATINMEHEFSEQSVSSSKDKEGSKAVTFASDPLSTTSQPETPGLASVRTTSPPAQRFVEDTPLMFSRTSSLGSLSGCEPPDDQGSVVSEVSRLASGCISPSDIPDSPGQSIPQSPRTRRSHVEEAKSADKTAPPTPGGLRSVFDERMLQFQVEHTPALFSLATSLSSLTIDDEPPKVSQLDELVKEDETRNNVDFEGSILRTGVPSSSQTGLENRNSAKPMYAVKPMIRTSKTAEEHNQTGDACKTYFTEDTPAILSKAGSNSNLSALSIDTDRPRSSLTRDPDTSTDSDNLSGEDNLLEQCIQKGIDKVVKNGSQSSEQASRPETQCFSREGFYRSLPPYLRSSTETVKMSHDRSNPVSERGVNTPPPTTKEPSSDESPPPPLPPKRAIASEAPPRPPPPDSPPLSLCSDEERILNTAIDKGITSFAKKDPKQDSRLPIKSQKTKEKPKPQVTTNLIKTDSLSSLSNDSFGSTDREIFEQTVKAGLSKVNPNARFALESKTKAHSVERPVEPKNVYRPHKSLDRNDKINLQKQPKLSKLKKRTEVEFAGAMTRSSFSYHGDTAASSLAHHSRYARRFYDDGPPSLPATIEPQSYKLERSNSLSSLSNDSFGSTDREVFERSVRLGMAKPVPKKKDLEFKFLREQVVRDSHRSRRRPETREVKPKQLGALEKMVGEEYSRDRAILEEVIARGAGEKPPGNSKNVQAPSAARASAGESANHARIITPQRNGSDKEDDSAFDTTGDSRFNLTIDESEYAVDNFNVHSDNDVFNTTAHSEVNVFDISNELPIVDSGNTTFESADIEMSHSNECLAAKSTNTTFESEIKDELNRSNESYAEVFDGSWSEGESLRNYDAGTLTRSKNKNKNLEWAEINLNAMEVDDKVVDDDRSSRKSTDTWNDNTVPDDVTFPTISGSVPMISSFKSDIGDLSTALPDLLEESMFSNRSFLGPDLTDKLKQNLNRSLQLKTPTNDKIEFTEMTRSQLLIENIPEPSFNSILEVEQKFDSIIPSDIEKEAARLAAQLKTSHYESVSFMVNSVTSMNSLDLENVKPPSHLGSLLSLTQSGSIIDDTHNRRSNSKSRKKSLPIALMVKRALTNSMTHQGSPENVDTHHLSLIENVKAPSEMDNLDMESSIISISSIVSEIAESRERTPAIFDLKQPITDFPIYHNFNSVLNDLDQINPPSLFDEMVESTAEIEQTTAHNVYEDCVSNTLNLVTEIASGSENCSPLPSDLSSVESTPKRSKPRFTPKEKRQISKDRYQTYTINDSVSESDVTLEIENDYATWTKSESDSRSDEYATANSDQKSKRRSAKQRRQEDRARYQTQTVNIANIISSNNLNSSGSSIPDPQIEDLKQRLSAKKTMKQRRIDEAERFRTRTLSEDIPPSPTFVTKDANFDNVETTTGYESLSSTDDKTLFKTSNEDDIELNSAQLQTFTKSFRNYLPVIESPTAVDICVVNNLKNLEMTASYRKATPTYTLEQMKEVNQNPSSSDFASVEGDSNSGSCDSEAETIPVKPKPKITKPVEIKRDDSLDSNGSCENEQGVKGIRGRKKALYVSPYRRNIPTTTQKKPVTKPVTKAVVTPQKNAIKVTPVPKAAPKTPTSRIPSTQTSPKRTSLVPKQSPPSKFPTRSTSAPSAIKPLPLERQGTFTKEESSIPAKDLPIQGKITPRTTKTTPKPNTSPSRLPQLSRTVNRQPLRKTVSNEVTIPRSTPKRTNLPNRSSMPAMKTSASNQSLQSNDSGKTITLASKHGSATSVNSISSPKPSTSKDVTSKIANLWRKVESQKKQPTKPDKRVWIAGETETVDETPKLIRSSTFDGPAQTNAQVTTAVKQKSAIAIRVSQIPSRFGKTQQGKSSDKTSNIPSVAKKPATKVFVRKTLNTRQIAT